MTGVIHLGLPSPGDHRDGVQRVNRLPILIATGISILFLIIVATGLSLRGIGAGDDDGLDRATNSPATSFGDQLKRGVSDGIIGDPEDRQVFQPNPQAAEPKPSVQPPEVSRNGLSEPIMRQGDDAWRAELLREQQEQALRERNRQNMARLQAQAAAFDSPIEVDVSRVTIMTPSGPSGKGSSSADVAVPRIAAVDPGIQAGVLASSIDSNGQASKEKFFNQDIRALGYLGNSVIPQSSRFELKRGSVIPATLVTGVNSDLPGRIIGQVSQNVYDSATGKYVLIPQGARLFGRYDSKISFGQERVLVIWTDVIFPDGATLQIGGMAGADAQGYGGFTDKVDRRLLRTFGSAALIAIIGTGIDVTIPQGSSFARRETASDAARRNFAETFGRAAEQTISKNLNVQPTIKIRPGYQFNVIVDQDIVFPQPS